MADHLLIHSTIGDTSLLNQILSSIDVERKRLAQSEPGARENLISQARKMISCLETPLETIRWINYAEPSRTFASRVALDLQLFQTLAEDKDQPKSAAELAKPTGASPTLVNRIARRLACAGMIDETGPSEYSANNLTRVLAISKYGEGIRFCYDASGPPFLQLPEYLEQKHYEDPHDPKDGPFQFAHKCEDPFSWLAERPRLQRAFHAYVHGQREDRPSWTDVGFYPVKERLQDGLKFEGDSSVLVDVGGGAGHVLKEFCERVPSWKGRLVLQEQQAVIDQVKSTDMNDRIELVVHDFFHEQPLKGARAYYMRAVLHDWNDDSSLRILAQIKKVMEPGYSKILINECVVADQGAACEHTSVDLTMMALAAARERTEKEWRDLIDRAGLRIGGIWSKGTGNESLIEVTF